ncbi:leucine--tRNA ligase [Patescibacteria group bacterium]|nr:leucine--tRNA ligase [Patescibacteria group bacterium]
MPQIYNHTKIEEKWLQHWEENKLFLQTEGQKVKDIKDKVNGEAREGALGYKMYLLFAFAYPSGQGLHVGHVESKTALDILARYYRMNGKNVFFPVGWDAFGLPAENYAIKTSVPPVETTKNAINTFRRQIKRLGISYDWANELATCHPGYYKWTQWLFLQLYKAGLAYQDTGMVNWCPSCQTVLANEQVVDGVCERCEAQVIQKEMKQWFFKITDYKDELISGLDQVDWPEPTKRQQLNWIGKKQGAEVDFIIEAPQDVRFNTNFLFDENYTEVFKAVRQFYFQELSGTSVYSPVLDDNISFTRAFWDHCICQDRKQSQLLYRLYSLPKIFELFYAENSKVFHKVGNDQKKRVEFWIWEKEIEGVQAQVVVRSINKGAKHLYSLVWKGMTEAYQSNKKIELSPAGQSQQRQGINTLQPDYFDDSIQKFLILSRILTQIKLKNIAQNEIDWGVGTRVSCFTTRPDTVFGVTFVVISPEKFKQLNLVKQVPEKRCGQVEQYINQAFKKTEEERQIGERDKTGVDTGLKAINPVNGQAVPVYVADYVLGGVGTGAVMGVPAHDERDFVFAKKHKLEIKPVIAWEKKGGGCGDCCGCGGKIYDINIWQNFYGDYGQLVNSGQFNGLKSEDALAALVEEFAYVIRPATTYKLRDWLISRQRYWGTPIPIVYDPGGKPHPVKEEHLPWELPTDVDFKPTGESPLKSSKQLKARTEKLYGKGWTPEYDTMDTFVDSSWYYLRYVSSRDKSVFSDSTALKKWLPVDFYMIGPEHIVLHLLYSRFFTKFLRDQGYLNFDEPFMKMRHQGMILGPDGKKMSKSRGNVISPDDVVEKFGADTLRMYEMFMGPIEADKPWDISAVSGNYRFLSRVYRLVQTWSTMSNDLEISIHEGLQRKLHQTIKKVSHDIPVLKFNTAIAAMMELVNVWEAAIREAGNAGVMNQADILAFIKILAPFAPFITEELYQEVAKKQVKKQVKKPVEQIKIKSIHLDAWPDWDEDLALEQQVSIAVQINGKVRGEVVMAHDQLDNQKMILAAAKKVETVQAHLAGKKIVKEIYVPGKIVSLVVN